jgi:hypothetical protein
MAGSRGDVEDWLRACGKSALATVLSARYKAAAADTASPGVVPDDPLWLWDIRVRVQPDGGRRFDAGVEAWRRSVSQRPDIGTIIPVLYDPSDHGVIIFDRRAHALHAAWLAEVVHQRRQRPDDETTVTATGANDVLSRAAVLERRRALDSARAAGHTADVGSRRTLTLAPVVPFPFAPVDVERDELA